MNVTAKLALSLVPKLLASQPVFLCIGDTMVSKFGKKLEDVSKLFDHATLNGSNFLNGQCFLSLMLCVPVWNKEKVVYLSVPFGYCMWQKSESKLELAAAMVRQVMPEFQDKRNVIILCYRWYVKKNLVSIVEEYTNLDLIGNARADSVICDFAPAPTGRKGRPVKHGKRLSIETDFILTDEKVGDYYTGMHRVLTYLFGSREVLAYVTASEKSTVSRRLFFSTVFPEQLQIFCAWKEKASLNQIRSKWMKYIPLFLYSFRWNIEVSYYEQKTFWSLCSYMIRSRKGIEMLVNLINIAYCAMKLLPYKETSFSNYHNESVQEFRLALSEQIRQQVFYATFVKHIETRIKSNVIVRALKSLVQQQGDYL